MELEKLKLHFAYIVGFLVVVMIVISTGLWTDKDNFTEYLTNAATAISIVLGLVAIFYSFISNSSLSQSLGNISKVSEEVVQTKSQIENFLKHADDLEKKGAENTNSLREISASVESHVFSLKEALGCITDKTQLLQESVAGRLDKFENILAEANNAVAPKQEDHKNKTDHRELAETFLRCSSLIGRVVIYGCVLANKSNKEFSITEIGKIFSLDTQYMHGFFVAMAATGLINYETVEKESTVFRITYLDITIIEKSQIYLISLLEKLYKKDLLDFFNNWQKNIATMENSFNDK